MCVRTWELPQHSDFFRTSAKFKVVWSQETDVSPTKKKKNEGWQEEKLTIHCELNGKPVTAAGPKERAVFMPAPV